MRPQTVPSVQQWTDDGGATYVPGKRARVVVPARDAALLGALADRLVLELADVTGALWSVAIGQHPEPGDVTLALGNSACPELAAEQSAEAYSITAGAVAEISAPAPAGLYYGTRTLLQLLRTGRPLRGTITDWPAYAQRGVMVDVGRKCFSPDWLERLVRTMGWLKLNHLHLHVNDNVGVGLECASHPEMVSDQHLSYADLEGILAVAAAHHVTVVPEFDTPSHAAAILAHHPELAITDRHGVVERDKIDVSLAAARELVADVVAEWAQRFPGPYFHLGGDEFFAAPWEGAEHLHPMRYPSLARFAQETTGAPGTSLDGYMLYLNELNALLKSHGKRARVWNDHVGPGGVELDRDIDVEVWIRWNTSYPSAQDIHDAGYRLVNRNGDHLYFVLSSDAVPAVSGRKSAEGIYELWHPHRFMGAAGGAADLDLDPDVPVAGAVMSIWCDYAEAMTEDEVAEQTLDWFRSFSQQLWGAPKPAPDFAGFAELFPLVGVAPEV